MVYWIEEYHKGVFYEVKDTIIYSICGNFDHSDYADDDGHADCG